ncbi:unnamed protein product [Didymodactylos carnosus]|uniref:Uncharacterized protein n=1 Tax=Didymodactylos carnosus TaxID=1234261 RepID=A0A813XM89_9BILA|nr:unnamed protein product [Didymodactylos carnosus]CAF0873563.1 unnamed protein product [Didymodactylos carnosus]CAF3502112.1 unnamed protein product [Didymodactylos carnosus]CAF3660776.1 unnamed protein product [Didymodactylos carnosus]
MLRRRSTIVNLIQPPRISDSISTMGDLTVELDCGDNSQEYNFSTYMNDALKLFHQFMQKINQIKHVQYILYHLCIGNQIIIKYSSKMKTKETIRPFISLLRLLLPDRSCRLVESSTYVLSCSANILILDSDASKVYESDIPMNDNNNGNECVVVLKLIIDDDDKNILMAKMETPIKHDFMVPTYIKTVIDLLSDTTIDAEAFESVVVYHKMKYLNKSKLLFQLGRCRSRQNWSDKQLLEILNLKTSADLAMFIHENDSLIHLGICDETSYGPGRSASCLIFKNSRFKQSNNGIIETPEQPAIGQIIRFNRMKVQTNFKPSTNLFQMKMLDHGSWLIFDGNNDNPNDFEPIEKSSNNFTFNDDDKKHINDLRQWLSTFDRNTIENDLDYQFPFSNPDHDKNEVENGDCGSVTQSSQQQPQTPSNNSSSSQQYFPAELPNDEEEETGSHKRIKVS